MRNMASTYNSAGIAPGLTDFLGKRIRPALVQHCHDCHPGSHTKAGPRLDARPNWETGGESRADLLHEWRSSLSNYQLDDVHLNFSGDEE